MQQALKKNPAARASDFSKTQLSMKVNVTKTSSEALLGALRTSNDQTSLPLINRAEKSGENRPHTALRRAKVNSRRQ